MEKRPLGEPVRMTAVIVNLLKKHGVEPVDYIRMTQKGLLDWAKRPNSFHSTSKTIEELHAKGDKRLPLSLPEIEGEIRRRRNDGLHFDIKHAILQPGLHWWEMVSKKLGDAQLRIEGVNIAKSQASMFIGKPLRDLAPHPLWDQDDIIIRSIDVYKPIPLPKIGIPSPGCIELKLSVPRIVIHG